MSDEMDIARKLVTANRPVESHEHYVLLPDDGEYFEEDEDLEDGVLEAALKRSADQMAAWNRGESRMRVTRFIDGEPVVTYETRQESEERDRQHRQARANGTQVVKRYAVEILWAGNNYSAHCPDVPGCIATGATLEEVKRVFQEALEFHFEGLREDGLPIPEPQTIVDTVDIAA